MGNNSGSGTSKQQKDANGFVVGNVFLAPDSRHIAFTSQIGTVCTQINGLAGTSNEVRFAELTSTQNCHFKTSATKAAVSGSLFTAGDGPYIPANFPKVIALGDANFIAARGQVGGTAGILHITLLE